MCTCMSICVYMYMCLYVYSVYIFTCIRHSRKTNQQVIHKYVLTRLLKVKLNQSINRTNLRWFLVYCGTCVIKFTRYS